MPLGPNTTQTFYRSLYATEMQTVTVLKRNNDQGEGTITSFTVFNCLLPGTEVEGRFSSCSKAFYSGEAIEFTVSNIGRSTYSKLRVTVNHPILTSSGFVAAGEIEEGDYLLCDSGNIKTLPTDIEYGPTLAEDVFESFLKLDSRLTISVPTSLDFHGDGRFTQGKVYVVSPNWKLLRDGITQTTQFSSNSIFNGANSHSSDIPSDRSFSEFGLTPFLSFEGSNRSQAHSPALFRSHVGTLDDFSFTSISQSDSSFFKDSSYSSETQFESFSKGSNGFSTVVSGNHIGGKGRTLLPHYASIGAGSRFDARRNQPVAKSDIRDSNFLGQLCDRFSSEIACNVVSKIRRFHYDGPVYNLESPVGYYIGSSEGDKIFLANCRHSPFSKVGETLQGSMSADDYCIWHFWKVELQYAGINTPFNNLDRIIDIWGRYWQPEAGDVMTDKLWRNHTCITCKRCDPNPASNQ